MYDKLRNVDIKQKHKEIADIVAQVESHPIFNPATEKISLTDRIIFIATTFLLRGLTLFLIDWGINSHLVNTFNQAFFFYTLVYITIFMVLALMVNAGEDGDNLSFKMLFYYINWGSNGVGRVLVHLGVLLFLIPIPFVVKEPVQGEMEQTTFEKRRAVYRVLSNFTFFVWVLTSLIALRY